MRHLLIYILFSVIVSSCVNTNNDRVRGVPVLASLPVDSNRISCDTSVRNLNSYNVSSYLNDYNSVYCYNYRSHSIDVIDLAESKVSGSIALEQRGPDAINKGVCALQALSPNSIAIYDGIHISLIDREGHVTKRIKPEENEFSTINSNSRMAISEFDIDTLRHTVSYPILKDGRHESLIYDYEKGDILTRISLQDPNNKGTHAYMQAPNVMYYGDLIVYNYPFESDIYIYDISDDNLRIVRPKSNFVDSNMPESDGESFEQLNRYTIENFFHSPLYHMDKEGMYARVTLGGTEMENINDLNAVYRRPVYIMFFDDDFNPLGESKLAEGRYDPFAGWFAAPGSVMFFVDNILHPHPDDALILDEIRYKAWN